MNVFPTPFSFFSFFRFFFLSFLSSSPFSFIPTFPSSIFFSFLLSLLPPSFFFFFYLLSIFSIFFLLLFPSFSFSFLLLPSFLLLLLLHSSIFLSLYSFLSQRDEISDAAVPTAEEAAILLDSVGLAMASTLMKVFVHL